MLSSSLTFQFAMKVLKKAKNVDGSVFGLSQNMRQACILHFKMSISEFIDLLHCLLIETVLYELRSQK